MSVSLRSPKPVGTRWPVPGTGRMRALEPPLPSLSRRTRSDSGGPDGRMVRAAMTEEAERSSRRPSTRGRHPAACDRRTRLDPDDSSALVGRAALTGVPSGRPVAPESGMAVRDGQPRRAPGSPGRQVRHALTGQRQRLSGSMPSWRDAQRVSRLGRRRGMAGLVAVCVLALGVAACSVKDSKAEASASASASASAAVARAGKGIADANASATASREAALTPELRAKRDAALAEPAPAKPKQMNEDSAEGAAASVRYFLELYRYAFMTGNTTELAAMSDERCKFCQSTIDDANDIHSKGGWADKWDQEIIEMTFYEKLEGYNYNRVKVVVNYGKMTSYYGDGTNPTTSEATAAQEVNFGVRYSNGRWMIGAVEAVSE